MGDQIVNQVVRKLGLAHHDHLSKRAIELHRLLSNKNLTSMNDTAKAVICVDLAATQYGDIHLHNDPVPLSGLKKRTSYQQARRTIEKLLDLNKPIGVSEICVQLGLSEVQSKATELLQVYKRAKMDDENEIGVVHPQYSAMAVWFACKKLEVKVSKMKLLPFSLLRPTQWASLEKNFEICLKTEMGEAKVTTKAEEKENSEPKVAVERVEVKETTKRVAEPEPYEEWKKRMLAKAYRDLKMQG